MGGEKKNPGQLQSDLGCRSGAGMEGVMGEGLADPFVSAFAL